jgi:hypothetical protein
VDSSRFVRQAAKAAGFVLVLSGCSRTGPSTAKAPLQRPEFASEEQKLVACLDLRDHIVDLYAEAYVQHEGLSMSPLERTAFRNGWAEELAKRGTFERFERSCFFGVTRRKYDCGMQSQTTDGLVSCMRLSER